MISLVYWIREDAAAFRASFCQKKRNAMKSGESGWKERIKAKTKWRNKETPGWKRGREKTRKIQFLLIKCGSIEDWSYQSGIGTDSVLPIRQTAWNFFGCLKSLGLLETENQVCLIVCVCFFCKRATQRTGQNAVDQNLNSNEQIFKVFLACLWNPKCGSQITDRPL